MAGTVQGMAAMADAVEVTEVMVAMALVMVIMVQATAVTVLDMELVAMADTVQAMVAATDHRLAHTAVMVPAMAEGMGTKAIVLH